MHKVMVTQEMTHKMIMNINRSSTLPRITGRNHSGLVGPVSLTVGLFASYRELKNFTKVESSKSSIIPVLDI